MEQVKEPMKEEREPVLAIACRIMTGVSPVAAANSQTPQPFPTPSPFSFSGTSTRWSSRPFIYQSNLFLRFLVFLFSFISALTLAAPSTKKKDQRSSSFTEYPELINLSLKRGIALSVICALQSLISQITYNLKGVHNWRSNFLNLTLGSNTCLMIITLYCFIVAISAFLHAVFQLFKGICDITHSGILISDKTSDYLSFVLDQLVAYLLISSASVTIPIIRQVELSTPLWKGTIVSAIMSFAAFLVIAISAFLSGCKLCKRIVW